MYMHVYMQHFITPAVTTLPTIIPFHFRFMHFLRTHSHFISKLSRRFHKSLSCAPFNSFPQAFTQYGIKITLAMATVVTLN